MLSFSLCGKHNVAPIASKTTFPFPAFLSSPGRPGRLLVLIHRQATAAIQTPVVLNSLRVLEWDKLCDSVASFAGTSLGKQAVKEQLWQLEKSYEESLRLLEETNAAVEMHKFGAMMDFSCIDAALVTSALKGARRGLPVTGSEALAVAALLQFADSLQSNVKAAMKEGAGYYDRFKPLGQMVLELELNLSLVKFIQQLIDEDGLVKDSASSFLKQSRNQVRFLERKLQELMDALIRKEPNASTSMELDNVDGRWCIRSNNNEQTGLQGLLLSSGSGRGNIVEPLVAIRLNDELQQARTSVAEAETEVLLKITEKMDLDDIENVINRITQLDMINARARYSISFGGTCPDLFFPQEKDGNFAAQGSITIYPSPRKWNMHLPKAYHPLLVQQHRQNLEKAIKKFNRATADAKKMRRGDRSNWKEEKDFDLSSLEMQVGNLKQTPPVPIDILINGNTKVLVITGPNTGGKTVCLKTVGLAAMMAKTGLYVLSSEPVTIPWFDFVLADIGDDQSLSQSLSTFSGHLKQISDIRSISTSLSLVLLDEVGAGTNPLEGAALGMSLLESFADAGAFLTIATTHHGELKTLKYSNNSFENACMEFDEVNLKPTYQILWGVPGRSNAINIAERLGVPDIILRNARDLYGTTSAEINEVILDMEKFKQAFHEHVQEAQRSLRLSRELRQNLLVVQKRVLKHGIKEKYRKMQEIFEQAAAARAELHRKLRQYRTLHVQTSRYPSEKENRNVHSPNMDIQVTSSRKTRASAAAKGGSNESSKDLVSDGVSEEKKAELVKVGHEVHVCSLNRKATVLKVEQSKGQIVVQAGNMKLKVSMEDVTLL